MIIGTKGRKTRCFLPMNEYDSGLGFGPMRAVVRKLKMLFVSGRSAVW